MLEVDFLWAGEFPEAGWLVDLKPFVDKSNFDLKPFIPSMLDLVGNHKGTLVMIPMYNYSMGIIYRTDLLSDPKLRTAFKAKTSKDLVLPTTLADYVEVSKFMNANAGVAGAAMQGQRGDPNSMEFSNYLFSSGGAYLDKDRNVALNSPEGEKALELYVDNIKNGAQKGALSATLDDTLRLMCDGKAWSMITYWWMLPQVDDKTKCPNAAIVNRTDDPNNASRLVIPKELHLDLIRRATRGAPSAGGELRPGRPDLRKRRLDRARRGSGS